MQFSGDLFDDYPQPPIRQDKFRDIDTDFHDSLVDFGREFAGRVDQITTVETILLGTCVVAEAIAAESLQEIYPTSMQAMFLACVMMRAASHAGSYLISALNKR